MKFTLFSCMGWCDLQVAAAVVGGAVPHTHMRAHTRKHMHTHTHSSLTLSMNSRQWCVSLWDVGAIVCPAIEAGGAAGGRSSCSYMREASYITVVSAPLTILPYRCCCTCCPLLTFALHCCAHNCCSHRSSRGEAVCSKIRR